MFFKKIYIEKQKNNRVFILFPSCCDLSKEKVRNRLQKIADIFAVNFRVKLTSKNREIAKRIQEIFPSADMLIDEEKKGIVLQFQLPQNDVIRLLESVDYDETSIELFGYDENFKLKQDRSRKENDFDFSMYIADNDGPSIIFDQKVYDFDDSVAKIKKILLPQ